MSPPGRPKGECFERQREANPIDPPGRPKGESSSAQRESHPVIRATFDGLPMHAKSVRR